MTDDQVLTVLDAEASPTLDEVAEASGPRFLPSDFLAALQERADELAASDDEDDQASAAVLHAVLTEIRTLRTVIDDAVQQFIALNGTTVQLMRAHQTLRAEARAASDFHVLAVHERSLTDAGLTVEQVMGGSEEASRLVLPNREQRRAFEKSYKGLR